MPFSDILSYFISEDLDDLILKESNYRLNTFEFVLQIWIVQKKQIAMKEYETNCAKEQELNYILRHYDSHNLRKELNSCIKKLEIAEKAQEEIRQSKKQKVEEEVEQEVEEEVEQNVEEEVEQEVEEEIEQEVEEEVKQEVEEEVEQEVEQEVQKEYQIQEGEGLKKGKSPAPKNMKHDDEKVTVYKNLYREYEKICNRLVGFDDIKEIEIPENLEKAIEKKKHQIKQALLDEERLNRMAIQFQEHFVGAGETKLKKVKAI
eukprot:g6586.t1